MCVKRNVVALRLVNELEPKGPSSSWVCAVSFSCGHHQVRTSQLRGVYFLKGFTLSSFLPLSAIVCVTSPQLSAT